MSPRLTTALATVTAVLLLGAGAALIFLPDEIAPLFGASAALPFSLLGAALLGLGEVTWMTRRNPMGGVYGRPVVMANLAHFVIGALTLVRHGGEGWGFWAVTAVYLLGAVLYGALLFVTPKAAS